ncbi:MAG TPA: hypothetical protein VGB26_05570 [Nitrospiria bacterium]|jgi:hypothetical protein
MAVLQFLKHQPLFCWVNPLKILTLLLATFFLFQGYGVEGFAQGTADIMHRAHGKKQQDLLIKTFEDILISGREGDWEAVENSIARIDDRVKKYDRIFGTRVRDKLGRSLADKNQGEILKYLAQTIFLGIKEQFKLIMDSDQEDYLDSRARLDRAKDYYLKILSGNIKRRDLDRHVKIEGHFLLAQASLGNPGVFIDVPVMEGDIRSFQQAVSEIETEVIQVYTYFNDD